MEKRKTKRMWMLFGVVTLMLVFFSSEAFSWGFATHVYINGHLGKRRGWGNANEIYGGMAPDVFNYLFDYPDYMTFLTEETHANFMKVWESARRGVQKSLAYGFVAHSVSDFTAHQENGYAMVKAAELLNYLPPGFREKVGYELSIQMLHIIVENAVDILIKSNDNHLIGRKIASAALGHSPQLSHLLVRAYASDFAANPNFDISPLEASAFIRFAEKEFRKSIVFYGQILKQDEPMAIRLISEQTADAAVAYLDVCGIDPSDLFQDEEELIQLIVALTDVAILICDDYREEIDATINFVDQWLQTYHVSY